MANTLKGYQTSVVVGLGTWTHITTTTNPYYVAVATIENPASSVVITISQSGSQTASVSSAAPAAAQESISLNTVFNCAAGDTITVAIASSNPLDNQLNTVKSTVTLHSGQS